jgi:uncharacterized protein (DUF2237 family)
MLSRCLAKASPKASRRVTGTVTVTDPVTGGYRIGIGGVTESVTGVTETVTVTDPVTGGYRIGIGGVTESVKTPVTGTVTVTLSVAQAKPTGNPAQTEREPIAIPAITQILRNSGGTRRNSTARTMEFHGDARVPDASLTHASRIATCNARVVSSPLPQRFTSVSPPLQLRESTMRTTIRERSRRFESLPYAMPKACRCRKHCYKHAARKDFLGRCSLLPWKGLVWGLYGACMGLIPEIPMLPRAL